MRYKEFEEKIEEWGEKHGYETEVEIGFYLVDVKIKSGVAFQMMAKIRTDLNRALDTDWESFADIKEDARAELFSIILKLAQTPIEDREDEEENIDSIINRLKEVQTNAEGVMSWEDIAIIWTDLASWTDVVSWMGEEIEKNRELINTLKDIIRDLEEYKEKQELPYEITDMQGMFSINNTDKPFHANVNN